MRIEIKTKSPVKDKDIKALYILKAGMDASAERMRLINLQYIADRYGMYLLPKNI